MTTTGTTDDGPDAGPNDVSDVVPGVRPDVVPQVVPDVGREDQSRHDPDHARPTAPAPRPVAELPAAVRQRLVQW
ncbi:MAG TPA: hypothetical protein VII33_06675, partial [Nakamurella sp.]